MILSIAKIMQVL